MKKLSILFLVSLLTIYLDGAEIVSAEIKNPYVLDEKPQVVFGDSVPVLTYFGLENYTQDYVGGYAHFTFTYTHDACCYTSDPPLVYITDTDPRSTSTPTERTFDPTYTLTPYWGGFGEPTDWYSYDIQFDAAGYTVVVTQATTTEITNFHRDIVGLTSSDWVAIANRHPITDPINNNSMSFAPVPIRETVLPPTPSRTPVIIVPGIMSSYLVRTDLLLDNERWPNLLLMSLSPDDLYLNDLVLTLDGNSIEAISPTSLLKNIGGFDFFSSLLNQFSEDQVVELFPYDWRLDIETSSMGLKEKIEKVKLKTGSNKINLVAHSMGGLVVKEYLKLFGNDSIEKFIDIATPHTGSPKSFKALHYGDNFGFEKFGLDILNPERAKIISQNMPSVYELLPSSSYGNYVYDLDDLDNNGVRGSLSYTDTKQFMKNTGRNSALVDRADAFHQNIDNLDPSDYGIETYNIIGCGVQTLGKIFVLNKETSEDVEYNISYINGDGTVPLKSAESILALKTYYAKNAVHATMPSTSGIKELIADILMATSTNNLDISLYPNLAESSNGCTVPDGKIVSFHSPIELHIYSGSNHVGPNTDGDIEINIPGVSYDIIDGNKFAFLPNGLNYMIKGKATATGTFNARIETVTDERIMETKYFNQVPIASTTEVTFSVGNISSNSISIDSNGDGIFESQVPVSAVLNEVQSGDLTKPVTKLGIKGNKVSEDSYISSVQISLSATDDNSGVLKTVYSLDGSKTWVKYDKTFVINDRGSVKLMYRSTDKAGNVESVKSTLINIINPGNSGNKK